MRKIVGFVLLLFVSKSFAQTNFKFYGKNNKRERVRFKLINNLIVLPLEINGKNLQFILDTGVNKTILFNLLPRGDLKLNSVEKITLQGLGSGLPVDAIISKGNKFRINNIQGNNQDLYVILKDEFDLSSKMGTTIHGIIGYDLLRNVIAKINYSRKVIDFYNPKRYRYKACKKCEVFPLQFYGNKPFINAKAKLDTIGNKMTDVKLLVDLGGSDAFWLFEGTRANIKAPKKYFKDFLGVGLSGSVYGKRSRISNIKLGKFNIIEPTVSFLDSTTTHTARKFRKRNGSIGAGILRRFKVWVDYPNKVLLLKKNNSFKEKFYYNMSGLEVVYGEKQLVREQQTNTMLDSYGQESSFPTSKNTSFSFVTNYKYVFKRSLKVKSILKHSPSYKAGVKVGDIITKANGKSKTLTLDALMYMFQSKPNKKIQLEILRNDEKIQLEFLLKKRI